VLWKNYIQIVWIFAGAYYVKTQVLLLGFSFIHIFCRGKGDSWGGGGGLQLNNSTISHYKSQEFANVAHLEASMFI